MKQRKSSTSLAARASRRSRSGGSSPHNRSSFTDSSVSSQESDSPSEYVTPSASRPNTPPTRLPTPSVKSEKGRRYTGSSKYRTFYNTGSDISSSDDEPGTSENKRDDQDRGNARQIYGGTESLQLSRMEDKLDELLSLEKQQSHEKKLETATEGQIQSSQSYLNLKDENSRLQRELEAIRMELADSQQAQIQTQSSMQDLEVSMEHLKNEISERMAQSGNEYYTLLDAYMKARNNRDGSAEESIKAWDKAKEYERENTILRQKISDLEDVNKELAGQIKAYGLENIRRKELQRDGASQTEPEIEPEVEPEAEPNSMESQRTETSFIDWDHNAKGEMELHDQGELESTEIQDSEQVDQVNRQEGQRQGLQDALQHDQHEAPQDKLEVRPEEPQETQQEDTQQGVTVEAEPHIEQTGEQEESQKELRDSQDEVKQDGATNNLEADQQEVEEDISLNEMLARVEGQLERLMSTTQEPGIGGCTETDNIEQQEMVETRVGNNQPTIEAPAELSPPETREVAPVSINHEPAITEPAHVATAESPRDRHRHRHGRHIHKRREAGDHHRDRSGHRDTDEKRRHRSDRLRNTDHRIQRRQQEVPVTRWIRSRSWGKTHFGIRLRRLIPMLNLRVW
ncbi:hypothetical protein NW768_008025 [Fusarium equiseti]|uniref:Uncharacterized protein n=1 Tax=Fusarium equiseti TaxID=61235 RepID=A0ABQ8R5L0_FUSEQ|nr:hypothetical protein NW768_008025 [Fusarium equiseti]